MIEGNNPANQEGVVHNSPPQITPPRERWAGALNTIALVLQSGAALVDLGFAGLEVAIVGVGCATGGIAGCGAGYVASLAIYNTTGNPIETALSNLSFIFTIAADIVDDNKLGEATGTALTTAAIGQGMLDPIGDLIIDVYGTGYSAGKYNSIEALFNGEGLLVDEQEGE